MKAIQRGAAGPALRTDAPEPQLGPGDALLRPECVAITELDRAVASGAGPDPDFAGVLGAQFVGVVDRIEKGGRRERTDLVGARVVASPDIVCAACDLCRAGLSAHCRERRATGAIDCDGAMAERVAIPAANLHALPQSLPDDQAIFALDVASVLQAVQQIRIEGKPYITVLGDGPVGLIAAQLMSRLNASVRLVGWSESRLDRCTKWGVKHRHIDDVGRRADQDIILDTTGAAAGFAESIRMVRPRGKVLLKSPGHWRDDVPAADMALAVSRELDLIGSRLGAVAEAVSVLARGEVDTSGLITRRVPLSEAANAFAAAADPDQVRIVIDI